MTNGRTEPIIILDFVRLSRFQFPISQKEEIFLSYRTFVRLTISNFTSTRFIMDYFYYKSLKLLLIIDLVNKLFVDFIFRCGHERDAMYFSIYAFSHYSASKENQTHSSSTFHRFALTNKICTGAYCNWLCECFFAAIIPV